MGYFDALTRGSFRTAQDGGRLFFPRGRFGRGYILPSEQDYERLRQQIGIYLIISIMLAVGLANLPLKIALPIYAALMVFYPAWMLRLLPRLEPSDEKWSPQESLIDRAWARSPATLWLAGIGALAF